MITATINMLPIATASSAPLWIAGWIIILLLAIGIPIYYTRKRRGRDHRTPR